MSDEKATPRSDRGPKRTSGSGWIAGRLAGYASERAQDWRARRDAYFKKRSPTKAALLSGLNPLRATANAVGVETIRDQAHDIMESGRRLRHARLPLIALPVRQDRHFDLHAIAQQAGVSVGEVEAALAAHRRRSAKAARLNLAGMGLAFGFGIWMANGVPDMFFRAMAVLLTLALCLMMGTAALAQAFTNWQIRSRKFGTLTVFLGTPEEWWPS